MDLSNKMKRNTVFIVSVAIAVAVILYGSICSTQLSELSGTVMSWVSTNFGWLYVACVFSFILFLCWVAISPWGKIRLGKDDERPEYSNFNWFAMLFCGATGIGLVFWSIAEPLSHYVSPPREVEAGTIGAAEFSVRTCFLHWGITQFACFAIVGLVLAYFQFRKGKSSLISNLLEPLVGEKATKGVWGKTVDIFSVVVTFAGVATSLGLGVSQICGGLNYLADVPNNNRTWLLVISVITCIFLASAISGVNKGIRILSSINTYIAVLLLTLGFLVGPKIPILNTLVSSTGQHIQYFFSDVTMINAFGDNTWIMNWRVFYYAWFIAWTPFVGMFIARISRGRTIREFIIGTVVAPTVFTILWREARRILTSGIKKSWQATEKTWTEIIRRIIERSKQPPLYSMTAAAVVLFSLCFRLLYALPEQHTVLETGFNLPCILQPGKVRPDRAAHQYILLKIHGKSITSEHFLQDPLEADRFFTDG